LEHEYRIRKLQISKAPLKSQAQGTSLFTSAELNHEYHEDAIEKLNALKSSSATGTIVGHAMLYFKFPNWHDSKIGLKSGQSRPVLKNLGFSVLKNCINLNSDN